jgi:hypothetical protein
MPKKSVVLFLVVLACGILPSVASAEGEAILALTGQYTFFIAPDPGSCETYYQKMVPCVLTETVPVPRRVVPVYPLPVSRKRSVPTLRSEIPVGCVNGPCLECFPRPTCRPATQNVVVPVTKPVRIPSLEIQPKCVKKRIMRPQWFKVKDDPRPNKRPRKIRDRG